MNNMMIIAGNNIFGNCCKISSSMLLAHTHTMAIWDDKYDNYIYTEILHCTEVYLSQGVLV